MAQANRSLRLSSPHVFLLRMVVFLILAGFVALILYRQIATAFMANPGLNGLILGVLLIGIILGLRQVIRLMPEIRWANGLVGVGKPGSRPPVLLAPMASTFGEGDGFRSISTLTLRALLDSVGTRLDESREIARYLTGLLIFLGLLGTFWGLLETVGSISGVIKSMGGSGDAAVMFDDLKNGLAAPIAGMSVSFTSSLFGLAGSLILGFLDLQAGQAQNRFYNELEDLLSASTDNTFNPETISTAIPPDLRAALDKIAASTDQSNSRAATVAMANLAEGIQGLVLHMRSEQQLIRDWVEAQASRDGEIRNLLERLTTERELR
ncbi:flagellar motor protein MotA [Lichenihabitans sp. PAMC28606]|uniref:flagellar motor protein MotA n=1 Tax=Lichenihabitans sp. PAMC28606 TaxID=2880932 RepID=UPI001D0B174D|nr:flagellar motor protein MotA [Lichenihabitans sp. PAMC28606]UDL96441.1 flagellar motor protein MotA [Lichenihabitans sp. PAMC28606]